MWIKNLHLATCACSADWLFDYFWETQARGKKLNVSFIFLFLDSAWFVHSCLHWVLMHWDFFKLNIRSCLVLKCVKWNPSFKSSNTLKVQTLKQWNNGIQHSGVHKYKPCVIFVKRERTWIWTLTTAILISPHTGKSSSLAMLSCLMKTVTWSSLSCWVGAHQGVKSKPIWKI